MTQLLAKTESGKTTVISSAGIVAFETSRADAERAVRDMFPDAPSSEVDKILDVQKPDAAMWRSLYATATAADLERIDSALEQDAADVVSLREDLIKAKGAQDMMLKQMKKMMQLERERTIREARADYEAEVARIAQALIDTHGVSRRTPAVYYENFARNHLENINHSTVQRLREAR
jgi:hypothetical protein